MYYKYRLHTGTVVPQPYQLCLLFLCSLYAVVVVRGQVSPGQTSYSAATSSISGAEYYITAAWDEDTLDQVPSTYVVGDGSRTIANGTTYNNVGLRSNTRYTIFIRIIIRSDVPNEVSIKNMFLTAIVYMETLFMDCLIHENYKHESGTSRSMYVIIFSLPKRACIVLFIVQ